MTRPSYLSQYLHPNPYPDPYLHKTLCKAGLVGATEKQHGKEFDPWMKRRWVGYTLNQELRPRSCFGGTGVPKPGVAGKNQLKHMRMI